MGIDIFYFDIIIMLYGALTMLTLSYSVQFFHASKDRVLHDTTQLRVLTGVVFGWLSFEFFYGWIFLYEPFQADDRIRILSTSLDMLIFPLVNFALTNVTHRKKVDWKLVLSHLVPFFVAITLALWVGELWAIALEVAFVSVYVIIMTIVQLQAGLRYNRYIRNQYSSLKGRDLSKLFWLFLFYLVLSAGWVLVEYFGDEISKIVCYGLDLAFLPVLKMNMDDVIITRETSRVDSDEIDERYIGSQVGKYREDFANKENVDEDSSKIEQFKKQLEEVCEKPRLYATEDLTREELCRAMGTNHTYFTRFLKLATGKNFNEYINALRIDYAEELLSDKSILLNDIPVLVGFSSKSSYYTAFKARHNCTPLAYRNRA